MFVCFFAFLSSLCGVVVFTAPLEKATAFM